MGYLSHTPSINAHMRMHLANLTTNNAISLKNDEELQIQAELHGISHTYIERKVLEAPLLRTTYCCMDGGSTVCRSWYKRL